MPAQSIVLHNQRNGSDKVFAIELSEEPGGWIVSYRQGRRRSGKGFEIRGNAGGKGTREPKPYDAALRIYRRLIREKLAEHYVLVQQTRDESDSDDELDALLSSRDQTRSGREPMFPILLTEEARALELCENPSYCAQEEEDGERRMLLKEADGSVRGIDRNGQYISLPAPILTAAPLLRANSFLIDGELTDETLRVWDLLELNGDDLRDEPMQLRYEQLRTVVPSYAQLSIRVVPTAFARADKRALLDQIRTRQGEGIVFKLVGAPYVEGSSKYAVKHTFRSTAFVLTVGATSVNRSIQVGVLSNDGIRFIGNVPIPKEEEMPALGTIVKVEYLKADPGNGSLIEARYISVDPGLQEADRYENLKFARLERDDSAEKTAA